MVPESLRLMVVGLNHRTAPLEVREGLAFTPERAAAAMTELKTRFPATEVVILSTCNRVELYLARPVAGEPSLEGLTQFLAEFHELPANALAGHIYHHEDRAMIEHLFTVAASLDSMVVGETQILAQVKTAYQQGCTAGRVGKVLPRAFSKGPRRRQGRARAHGTFRRAAVGGQRRRRSARVGLRSLRRQDGGVHRGGKDGGADAAASGGAQAAEDSADQPLASSGAGARPGSAGFPRTGGRGGGGGEVREFAELDALLVEGDIVLTSTGASEPIITESRFKGLLKARRYRPAVIVDIAVPRDVDANVSKLSNVYLYNIDDLQAVAAGNRDKRNDEIAVSRALLATHVEEFLRWYAARDIGPVVKALYERCHALAKAELDAVFARRPQMTAEERAEFERLTHRLVGKILHEPVTQLTTRAQASARPTLSAALTKLFSLGGGRGTATTTLRSATREIKPAMPSPVSRSVGAARSDHQDPVYAVFPAGFKPANPAAAASWWQPPPTAPASPAQERRKARLPPMRCRSPRSSRRNCSTEPRNPRSPPPHHC